ncbi:MAG: M48 family peptidase [Acidobacteria bacterium]|nr:M48 family peptidase [Acidobacteriota bacterium]
MSLHCDFPPHVRSEELTVLACRVYAGQHKGKPLPSLEARFCAYTDLNHTVRRRNGRIDLRISDVMADAPAWALQAIVGILLLKLDRRKVSPRLGGIYRRYAESPEVRARVQQIRRARGRKVTGDANGRFFDLQAAFERLNRHYFQGTLRVRHLIWSRRKTRRILGHYDRCHDTIVVSKSLDAEWVPPLLFEYILFHEMLHAHTGERYQNGKRYSHHREFKAREREFERYREARQLMRQFAARIR